MWNKRKWYSILPIGLVLLLASSVGACAPAPTSTPTATPTLPADAISWDEAEYHYGESGTVYGPVVGTEWASGSKGEPTFLHIGNDYPNEKRVTVVIWSKYRANFTQAPEVYYLGKSIYVTGLIKRHYVTGGVTEYRAIPQIEVRTPDQIQIQ